MHFGIFDHLDSRDEPAARIYDGRIALVRAAEQAGFRGYHLAEHHGTPLGLAPSPALFLAAVARETSRILLVPSVLCLPLYNPLRLLEEICMLDQLSNGRVEIGAGRGVSPIESGFYGMDPAESAPRYVEIMEILRAGLQQDTLDYRGRYYRYEGVPLPVRPLQKNIRFWSAAMTPEARGHAAASGMDLMVLGANERVREAVEYFMEARSGSTPLVGASRMLFVGETDADADARAAAAFDYWHRHLALLWRRQGLTSPILTIDSYEKARGIGMMIAGSPSRVADELAKQIEFCGYNYAVLQFAFGDLGHAAEMRSLELFVERVMPQLV